MITETDPQKIIDMIRTAYARARITRSPVYVVTDDLAECGWAVDSDRRRIDRLILGPINPPPYSKEMLLAESEAVSHVLFAAAELGRAAEIIAANPDGSPRNKGEVDDLLDELLRSAVDLEHGKRMEQWVDYRHLAPKRSNFFTRLFGSAK